jgi:hypothetical protein
MINAEIQANNKRIETLGSEQNMKIVQNVAGGVVGPVVWPVFFATDAKARRALRPERCSRVRNIS